jgi:hypothetical protein
LVKGALFLGVGIVAATGARHLRWVLVAMALLALSLAGLPFTSGALAKFAAKPLFGSGLEATLMKLSAAGSALLMLHFMVRLRTAAASVPQATPAGGLALAWGIVALASLAIPWALFSQVTGYGAAALMGRGALWDACWTIALGAGLAALLHRFGQALPRIPEGDAIVLAERLSPVIGRISDGIGGADLQLRRWPAASLILVLLVIGFTAALRLGG